MLPQHGLGYLNFCLQQVKNNQEPFGGVQAVFVGDFNQVRLSRLPTRGPGSSVDTLCCYSASSCSSPSLLSVSGLGRRKHPLR